MNDTRKQLKNAYEIVNSAEYYKVDNLNVVIASRDIVIDYTTAGGWSVHNNVHPDGSIYMEYYALKTEDNENVQKRTTYNWTIPATATRFTIIDQWIYWIEIDENGNEVKKEVLVR